MGINATAAAATSSGSSSTFLILIVVVFIGFYFLLIRPQRNRQRKVMEQQKTVQPGARVRTTAGMYATVVAVDGDDVVLEVAPDVEVRFMKRAIMEVIGDGPGAPEADEPVEDDETEDAVDEAAEPGEHAEDDPAHPAESDPEITVYHSGNGSASSTDGEADAKSGTTASKE
jgi:preprotein translocase subunit YajC